MIAASRTKIIKMRNDSSTLNTLLEALDADVLNAMLAHLEEQGSTAAAYVVPMSRIFTQAINTEERCVVIAVPQTSRQDVDINHKRIYSEVCIAPDRTSRACLMLAGGAVALTEAAIITAAPDVYGRLMVVWVFADEIVVSEHQYRDDHDSDLGLTSRMANSHDNLYRLGRRRSGPRDTRTVVEVFESFEMDSSIPD